MKLWRLFLNVKDRWEEKLTTEKNFSTSVIDLTQSFVELALKTKNNKKWKELRCGALRGKENVRKVCEKILDQIAEDIWLAQILYNYWCLTIKAVWSRTMSEIYFAICSDASQAGEIIELSNNGY